MMKATSGIAFILILSNAPQIHAEPSGRAATIQLGLQTLYGQEFTLDFCRGTVAADVQCLSNLGQLPPGTNQANCVSCDTGTVVSCEAEHYLRTRIPDSAYHFTWWPAQPPRRRIDVANGWIGEVNYVHCQANRVHDFLQWNEFISEPQLPNSQRSPEAVVMGFASHVRPAFARGTIITDNVTEMTLVLEQFNSTAWTPVAQMTWSGSTSPVFEISGYVEPTATVRVRARLPFAGSFIKLRDVRLFVEQCVPDVSRPGQCLGDP